MKSYRSALFAYRMNLLNALLVLLRGHSPISIIPMDSVFVILESVAIEQSTAKDHLALTISVTNLLQYCDSGLLADAITIEERHLLNVSSKSFYTFWGNLFSKWPSSGSHMDARCSIPGFFRRPIGIFSLTFCVVWTLSRFVQVPNFSRNFSDRIGSFFMYCYLLFWLSG